MFFIYGICYKFYINSIWNICNIVTYCVYFSYG